MINRVEAERIAGAIHHLRPDWPLQQLMTLLAELRDWPMLDAGVGLAYIALDSASKSPYRVKEQGPWRVVGIADPAARTAGEQYQRRMSEQSVRAEARRRCEMCDEFGRLPNGWICAHDPDLANSASVGAALARAQIRPTRAPGAEVGA